LEVPHFLATAITSDGPFKRAQIRVLVGPIGVRPGAMYSVALMGSVNIWYVFTLRYTVCEWHRQPSLGWGTTPVTRKWYPDSSRALHSRDQKWDSAFFRRKVVYKYLKLSVITSSSTVLKRLKLRDCRL